MKVDVYPVGVLADLRHIRGAWKTGHRHEARAIAKDRIKYLARQAQHRKWRTVRQSFNGYLAEYDPWPDGIGLTRCGSGWTRRRAVTHLHQLTVTAADRAHLGFGLSENRILATVAINRALAALNRSTP